MFMRFRGGSVGHKATCDWDVLLQNDEYSDIDCSIPEDNDSTLDGPDLVLMEVRNELEDITGSIEDLDDLSDGEWDVTSQSSASDEDEDPIVCGAELDDDTTVERLGYGAL